MEWLGKGSSPGAGGANDIATQLQNLLQIPAIEKKTTSGDTAVMQIQQSSTSTSSAQDTGQDMIRPPVVARYCSDLEAEGQSSTGKEGKENLYPPPGGIRISASRGRTTRTEIYYPARSKPPALSRQFNRNSGRKREVKDQSLVRYLEDRQYGLSTTEPDALRKPSLFEPFGNEFPDFLIKMIPFQNNESCPTHFYVQQDLIARNTMKLDGIENLGEYFATMDDKLKTMLRAHFVEPLSRKSSKNPSAKFVCNLCSYYNIRDLMDAIQHISWPSHLKEEREQYNLYTLESVAMASDEHCEAIGELISKVSFQHDLSQNDIRQRERIIDFLQDIMKDNEMECEVSMFGSAACGLAFKFSNLNINVTFGNTEDVKSSTTPTTKPVAPSNASQHFNNVAKIVDILTAVPHFREVTPRYLLNKTHISFIATEFGGHDIHCLMQFNNKPALLLVGLFKEYIGINSMVRPILRAFRYWARICQIDNQDNGYLPPHAYTIMALHYLQEIRMIPVLQAVPRVDSSRPFATALESFKAGFPNNSDRNFSHAELGKLWLSLMYYYAVKFDNVRRVVTISRTETLSSGDSPWNRKLAIEDPIIPSTNISRSTSNNKICDYIVNCTKSSFLYFAIPQSKEHGPLYAGIFDDRLVEDEKLIFFRHLFSLPLSSGKRRLKIVDSTNPVEQFEGRLNPTATFKMTPDHDHHYSSSCLILFSALPTAHAVLKKEEYFYNFDIELLGPDYPPPESCKACGSERHMRRDCPEERLPPISDVQAPNTKSLLLLRRIIMLNSEKLGLNEMAYRTRLEIKNHVYNLLAEDFPEVQLTMFGSTESGFGLKSSDLDLCMTLRSHCFINRDDILRYIDANDTLTKVVNCLKRSSELVEVFSITTAKVPIVKYHHKLSGLDGDISFYNLLALRNTLLLKAYNQLDARVKILGCLIKKLGKLCEISDASKGSISSYAYMLMLIHYLQHTKTPVLPVLQEIPPLGHPPKEPLPTYIVESWDSYFFDDLSKMQYAWKDFGRNTDPVEELWLGFLQYYTEVFDFDNHVVSIARHGPVTRREKAWYSDCIAIEDPFEKAHNLGSGLTKRMSVHIIKTLRNFRKVFHSNVDAEDVASARIHYFNRNTLVEGKLPIDRQCRICHRIGHIARNCQRQRPSDTESLDGDDDDDLITTLSGAQQAGSNNHGQATPLDSIFDGRPSHPALDNEFPRQDPHCVLDDFRYFWNIDEPKNQDEIILENMITKSPGVSFSTFLKDKATTIQAKTPSPETLGPFGNMFPQMHQYGPNFNGTAPTNPMSGVTNVPPHLIRYSLQDANSRFDTTQTSSNNVAGSLNYPPPGLFRLPPPPPGFSLPVPMKLGMAPSFMTNGNEQGHNIPQMYRFPVPGNYINFQQLPQNTYPQNNGTLNPDLRAGPRMTDSSSWQPPPGTVHPHREEQGREWDVNRH